MSKKELETIIKKNKEEAIAYYTQYRGNTQIDCTQWQRDVIEMAGHIDTVELLFTHKYDEKFILDYILFISRNKKQYFYLSYFYTQLKNGSDLNKFFS